MTGSANTGSTWDPGEKTHKDENFPVASKLISKRHREPIMAFYRFARASDDVADHPNLNETQKIETLDLFEATLLGQSDAIADALPLRAAIAERNLSPKHAQDLLVAFRWDARKQRYETWDDLMRYCTFSAMPVGRFVLDVHGESRATWAANDALCAALQVINHLQDCGEDYRKLDRVYIPLDALAKHNVPIEALGAAKASPELRGCIIELAAKTKLLLTDAKLSSAVKDFRLSLEVAAIQRLAGKLVNTLLIRDPLSERVHLSKSGAAATLVSAAASTMVQRMFARKPAQPSFAREG